MDKIKIEPFFAVEIETVMYIGLRAEHRNEIYCFLMPKGEYLKRNAPKHYEPWMSGFRIAKDLALALVNLSRNR